jgi:protein-arginine kinase activator protein McsA
MKYLKLFENFDEGPRYKVGQRVVALSNSKPNSIQPRVKGKIYTIDSILFCSGCGKQFLNFGTIADEGCDKYGTCSCGTKTDGRGLVWTSSIFYAPIDDIDSQIEKAIEEEDYELAAPLRDIKKEELVS